VCSQWIDLPSGSFRREGTTVNTAIVVVEGYAAENRCLGLGPLRCCDPVQEDFSPFPPLFHDPLIPKDLMSQAGTEETRYPISASTARRIGSGSVAHASTTMARSGSVVHPVVHPLGAIGAELLDL
jgi:hypothetical protein